MYRSTLSSRYFSPAVQFRTFSLLFLFLFFIKGIVYLAILPPFEGWDEYQHLAYIDYLGTHHTRPILNKSHVSHELLQKIVQYPVPQSMYEQLQSTGVLKYIDFFKKDSTKPEYIQGHHDIQLYQAQHGSLYYKLMLPLSGLFSPKHDLLNKISSLRLINLVFATSTLAIIFWLISRITLWKSHTAPLALLITCQPLLLINSCRIANDPLAILSGTVVIALGLLPEYRQKLLVSVAAGLLVGFSCWTKSTSTILFPYWICVLTISWINKEISLKKMTMLTALFLLFALLVLRDYLLFNYTNYKMLFVMQEAIVNANNHRGIADLVITLFNSSAVMDIVMMWFRETIWIGGWSFLKVHSIRNIVAAILMLSILGWLYHVITGRKQQGILPKSSSALCLSTCVFMSMAMIYHYLQSTLAWGQPTTCQWYLSISLPFFLIFVYDGAHYWSKRVAFILSFLLALVYIYADIRGSLTMISYYSGGAKGSEALARISSLHPLWLGTPTLIVTALIFLCLLAVLLFMVLRHVRSSMAELELTPAGELFF